MADDVSRAVAHSVEKHESCVEHTARSIDVEIECVGLVGCVYNVAELIVERRLIDAVCQVDVVGVFVGDDRNV
jgi:hypothetical protein